MMFSGGIKRDSCMKWFKQEYKIPDVPKMFAECSVLFSINSMKQMPKFLCRQLRDDFIKIALIFD